MDNRLGPANEMKLDGAGPHRAQVIASRRSFVTASVSIR
jgi:hypothetical protein